jgi:uncharacterized membrane protein YsdA (DUF1294 family)
LECITASAIKIDLDLWLLIIAWYSLLSVATLFTYAWDKRRAKVGGWRIPEFRLQLLALAGGWLGAHAARALLRHKTRKPGFSVVLWLITLLHVSLLPGIALYQR